MGTPRRIPLSAAALAVLGGLPRRLDGHVFGVYKLRLFRNLQSRRHQGPNLSRLAA